jgi:hypothetical protein
LATNSTLALTASGLRQVVRFNSSSTFPPA